jgi:hypothetical protein
MRKSAMADHHPRLSAGSTLLLLAAAMLALAAAASGQVSDKPAPAGGLIRVWVEGFVRPLDSEADKIPFVRFVAERGQAQVLVAIEPGLMRFTGLAEFEKTRSEYPLPPLPGETPQQAEGRILQTLRLGLLRYVSKSPTAGQLTISLLDAVKPTSVVDPWRFWVFSLSGNSYLSGQEAYGSESWYGSFSANRVTPEWKIQMSAGGSLSNNRYTYDDYDYTSTSNSISWSGLAAKSLGEHWSVGVYLKYYRSTYANTRWSVIPRPALEYNLFPYSESTKRQLRITYTIGPTFIRYDELTIYDKTRETLLGQSLSATLDLKQPWGAVEASLTGSHYLHDLSKYQVGLSVEVSIRLFKGFNLNLDGSGSRIHDQLNLAKGGATYEEVLLQKKQLATGYEYSFSAGFSYSFGSIFSNIINPRFGSGSDGISISVSM